MDTNRSGKPFYIAGSVLAVWFVLFSVYVTRNSSTAMDLAVIAFVGRFEHPLLTVVMKSFTWAGSETGVAALTFAFLLVLTFWHRALGERILFLAVMSGSVVLNVLLKAYYHRERPDTHRLIEITGYSFPSWHSMLAVSFYGILGYFLYAHARSRTAKILLFAFCAFMIAAIGTSRVYLGVHYPTDILAGWLAAGCWLCFAIGMFRSSLRRIPPSL